MQKALSTSFLFVLSLSFFSSCVLENVDESFVEIESTPDPYYYSDLQYSYGGSFYMLKTDTIWLDPQEVVKVLLSEAIAISVYLDGNLYREIDDSKFNLDGSLFNNEDLFELVTEQQTKSGTNSLADRLGQEFVTYTDTFLLKIAENRPTPQVLSIVETDGTLEISWEQYTRGDFHRYILIDRGANIFASIDNQNQTTFTYDHYVGQNLNFRLFTNRGAFCCGLYGENQGILKSSFVEFVPAYVPNFTLTKVEDDFILSWDPLPYYKNVNSVSVERQGGDRIGAISDATKTSITLNFEPIEGEEYRFFLITSSYPDPENDFTTSNYEFGEVRCCN